MTDGRIKNDGTSRSMKATLPATYDELRTACENGTQLLDLLFNADGWEQIPDFLNKANLLKDETAALLAMGATAKVNEVLNALIPRIGDIKVTARKNLSDCWLLCNGDVVDDTEEYAEFRQVLDPNKVTMWTKSKTVKVTGLDGYTIPSQKPCYDGTYYYICGYKFDENKDVISQHVFYSTDCKTWTSVQFSTGSNYVCNIIYVAELNQYCVLTYTKGYGRLYVYYTSNPRSTSWTPVRVNDGNDGARVVVGSFEYLNGYFTIAVTYISYTDVYYSKNVTGEWKRTVLGDYGATGNLIYDDSDGTTFYKMIKVYSRNYKAYCSIYKDFEGQFSSYNTYTSMGEADSFGAYVEKIGNKFIVLTRNGVFSLDKLPFSDATTKLSGVNLISSNVVQPILFTIEDTFHGGYLCYGPLLDSIMRFDSSGNYVEAIPCKFFENGDTYPTGYMYYELNADGKPYKFGIADTDTNQLTYYTLDVFLPEISVDGAYAYIKSKNGV